MRYPGPVSGMHQTRAGVRLVTLPNAVRDTRGPRVAYRLAASSRYSASSSALAALSTWPATSQRLAQQMVPPIAFGTVQICHPWGLSLSRGRAGLSR
jgi:hypothetical protein